MTSEIIATTLEVLGKPYQIKCPQSDVDSLQEAARFLEEKVRTMRSNMPTLTPEKLIVMAALSLTHQFLALEKIHIDANANEMRLRDLQQKIERAISQNAQLEL